MTPVSAFGAAWARVQQATGEIMLHYVKLESHEFDSDFDPTRHWVDLSNPIEYNVDGRHENFPHAVQGKEMAHDVEVASLPCCRVFEPLLDRTQRKRGNIVQSSAYVSRLHSKIFSNLHISQLDDFQK